MESSREFKAIEAIKREKEKYSKGILALLANKYIGLTAKKYHLPYKVVQELSKGLEVLPNDYYPLPSCPSELSKARAKLYMYENTYSFESLREHIKSLPPEHQVTLNRIPNTLIEASDEIEAQHKTLLAEIDTLVMKYPPKTFEIGSYEWGYYFAHLLANYDLDKFTRFDYVGGTEYSESDYKALVEACTALKADYTANPSNYFNGVNKTDMYKDTCKSEFDYISDFKKLYEEEQNRIWQSGCNIYQTPDLDKLLV